MRTAASFETERWQPYDTVFDQALVQLCTMGMLIDLSEYLQTRSDAVLDMQQAWPLKKHHDFTAALDFFILVVGNTLLTTLRHVLQLRSQVSTFQKELLTRRAFDTGRRYISACCKPNKSGSNDISSFERAVQQIRDELITLYRARKDYSEANRLHTSQGIQGYLAEYSFDMMITLSDGLYEAVKSTFGDIKAVYRQILDPSGTLKICAAHLAILSGRMGGSMDPSLCTVDTVTDIIGRNVLHCAAEVKDVEYLRWALQHLPQRDKSILERRDNFGLTPLMIAAYVGCLDTFKLLVKGGADLKAQDPSWRSILCLASMAGNESIVTFILSQGVKVQDCIEYCSPLHDAVAAGRAEAVVRTLLDNKAEPRDERNEHGNLCASQIAAKNGHTHLAKILTEAEQKLERQLPTERIDPYGAQIRSLKRQVEDAMARSASPESPASGGARTMAPASENARSKRHRSVSQRQWSTPYAGSLSFQDPTPLMLDGLVVPGALMPNPIDMYSADIAAKLKRGATTNPFQDFSVDDADEFSPLFSAAGNSDFVDLTEDES
ncbi:hypothetical protein PMZ80_008423 [Knufia obscura]|uniref:Ankyrin repeat protein n=2 Tax=Knufia TaxID=430999 RepID=A0AAN8EH02_9EURO|nr:hypothetical protein PMZ80_008423 [Knufia obscura]KAK5951308.1 hypothetical protein OHC33_007726 [Knufia fluminis]